MNNMEKDPTQTPFRILIFGASGMVGSGVLRECLLDPDVTEVKSVGRRRLELAHPKLQQLIVPDISAIHDFSADLQNFDACFFSLGASAAGLSEEDYSEINHDLPLMVANLLHQLNPHSVFVYVSGLGTDSSEQGSTMWARVKGRTENDIMKIPFKAAYMFRPGGIIAMNGEVSSTRLYRWMYSSTKPFHKFLLKRFPKSITTTEEIGQAMLAVAKHGQGPRVVENREFKDLARSHRP
ncbi:MAG: hypothetical protein J7501_11875 [Bdellovibrio sp.]|nr:hypothetical protein [Bdellovibrio sp.]